MSCLGQESFQAQPVARNNGYIPHALIHNHFGQRFRVTDNSSITGVYYQAFMLASPRWRRIASWICGWAYLVGNITITLAVNFGTTLFFVSCINVFAVDDDHPVLAGEPYQVFLIFLGITLLCNAVSALGNKWLPWLDVCKIARTPVLFCSALNRVHGPHANAVSLDCCHLLDLCWCHCHHGLCSGHCQTRSSRCQVGFHTL